jgi:hypothetical protein
MAMAVPPLPPPPPTPSSIASSVASSVLNGASDSKSTVVSPIIMEKEKETEKEEEYDYDTCYCGEPLLDNRINQICGKHCPLRDKEGGWFSTLCFNPICKGSAHCGRAHIEEDMIGCTYCRQTDHVFDFCAAPTANCTTCNKRGHVTRSNGTIIGGPRICSHPHLYSIITNTKTGSAYWKEK